MKLGIYRHYKGNRYRVLGLAQHTETLEELVVYVPLYSVGGPQLYARPRAKWDEPVDGKPRFVFIGDQE